MTTLGVLAYWTVIVTFVACLAVAVYAIWGHHLDHWLSEDEASAHLYPSETRVVRRLPRDDMDWWA